MEAIQTEAEYFIKSDPSAPITDFVKDMQSKYKNDDISEKAGKAFDAAFPRVVKEIEAETLNNPNYAKEIDRLTTAAREAIAKKISKSIFKYD